MKLHQVKDRHLLLSLWCKKYHLCIFIKLSGVGINKPSQCWAVLGAVPALYMKQQCQCLTPHCLSFLSTSCPNSGPTQPKQKIRKRLFQSCAKENVCLLLEGGAACWVTLTHRNVRIRFCFDANTNKEDSFVNFFTVKVPLFGTWQRPLWDWFGFVFGNTV